MPAMDDDSVEVALESLPGWEHDGARLRRRFAFPDFTHAFGFSTLVALEAQARDHHPDLQIRWDEVTVVVTSHSQGGVTEACIALARACDRLGPR